MKLSFIVLALVFLAGKSDAQTSSSRLTIGDRMPHVDVRHLINSKITSLNTSSLEDKLVIVDFWATTCSGCVAALPKMESLQQKFGDKVFILPVTEEPKEVVTAFWKRNKNTKNLSIPSAVNDSIFSALFPYEAVPHEVWVYKGKVIGITEPDYVDAWNISQVLAGAIPNWPVKNDYYTFDGRKERLFRIDNTQVGEDLSRLKYAAISDYKEKDGASAAGLFGSSGIIRDSVQKQIHSYFINQGIFTSYALLWSKIRKSNTLVKPSTALQANQIVWEVPSPGLYQFFPEKDSSHAVTKYLGDWKRRHAICFEALYPDKGQNDAAVSKDMIADLDRLLGLNVRWERRNEKVLKLIRIGKPTAATSKSGALDCTKITASDLVYNMNNEARNPYVFDETKTTDGIEMIVNIASWTDIAAIQKALAPYHLALKEEVRAVDKFIFSELNGSLLIDPELIARSNAAQKISETARPVSPADNQKFLESNKTKPGVTVTASGLQYEVVKAGTGRKPSANELVSIHYNGTLINGRIFDSSFDRGKAAQFQVSNLVEGLKEGLQLMNEGSKYIFYIPASLGYGDAGSDNIPGKSTLIFEAELLKIIK